MPAPRGAPREVPGQRLPGARVWLKGGEGRRSPRAGTEQTCSSSALRGFIHTEMNGTEEAWLVGLFVFNPSPSPTPHNLQHRTEINTRSRGGGCCPRGATTTPPITTHPRQGKVSRSWGAPFQPPRAAWEANPKEHCPPAGTGGAHGVGQQGGGRAGGAAGGTRGVTPAPGAAGSGLAGPRGFGARCPRLLLCSGPAVCSSPRHSWLGNQGCVRGEEEGRRRGPHRAHSSPSSLRLTLRGLARGRLGGAGEGPPSLSAWLEPRERRSWLCLRRKSTGAGQP